MRRDLIFRLVHHVLVQLIAISTLLAVQTPPEGLILHKESSSFNSALGETVAVTSTMYLSLNSVRELRSDGLELIVFNKEQKLVSVNHADKTYSEISFEELDQTLNRISEEINEHAEEQERTVEMLQRIIGGKPGEISIEKLGPGPVIAGYQTEEYEVQMPPLLIHIWAAPDLAVPEAYFDSMKIYAVPNPLFDMKKMFDVFKQVSGLSLKTDVHMNVMGVENRSTDEVTKVERVPVADPVIPSDYLRVPLEY